MLSTGWGMVMNIIWMVLIILLTGTYLFFNVSCLMSNDQCVVLSWTTVAIVVMLTLWIIINSLVMDHLYRKKHDIKVRPIVTTE
jgi:branched-subunit amino acid ABC-type transport system permease component